MRNRLRFVAAWVAAVGCAGPPPPAPEPSPLSPRAATTTADVLAYLRSLPARPDRRLLSGQNIGHGPGAVEGYSEFVDGLRVQTGQVPAFVTVDYALGSLDPAAIRDVNRLLIAHWNRGGLVSVNLASLGNPLTGGNCRDRSNVDLPALLRPGTPGNAAWRAALDTVAAGLAELRNAGVVVLFRPLHEMNIDAFWWGMAPPADYVALWRDMHRFLTADRALTNLLWVYAPAANPWGGAHIAPVEKFYPGAELVDVAALDYYANDLDHLASGGMDALLRLGKPFGVAEYGPELDTSQFASRDLRAVVAGFRARAPQAVFWWHWHSYGLSRMALVDQENAGEALADPWVVNRDGVEVLPTRTPR